MVRGRFRGISDRFHLMNILGVSVVDFLADLLGESELHSGTSGSSELSDALLLLLLPLLHLWDSDALLLGEILAGDPDQINWLVDTLLHRDGVGHRHLRLGGGDHRDVVAGLLGHLLAVVVSIGVVAIARLGLTHCHHLSVALPREGNCHRLRGCLLSLLGVGVDTDLVVDDLNTLGTDSPGDWVALLHLHDSLHRDSNGLADSLEGWSTHLSCLHNINNTAVMLWGCVSRGICNSMVGHGMVNHGGCMVDNRSGMVGNSVVSHSMVGNWGMVGYGVMGNWGMMYKRSHCMVSNSNWSSMHSMVGSM